MPKHIIAPKLHACTPFSIYIRFCFHFLILAITRRMKMKMMMMMMFFVLLCFFLNHAIAYECTEHCMCSLNAVSCRYGSKFELREIPFKSRYTSIDLRSSYVYNFRSGDYDGFVNLKRINLDTTDSELEFDCDSLPDNPSFVIVAPQCDSKLNWLIFKKKTTSYSGLIFCKLKI
jgi:hypothetical protein